MLLTGFSSDALDIRCKVTSVEKLSPGTDTGAGALLLDSRSQSVIQDTGAQSVIQDTGAQAVLLLTGTGWGVTCMLGIQGEDKEYPCPIKWEWATLVTGALHLKCFVSLRWVVRLQWSILLPESGHLPYLVLPQLALPHLWSAPLQWSKGEVIQGAVVLVGTLWVPLAGVSITSKVGWLRRWFSGGTEGWKGGRMWPWSSMDRAMDIGMGRATGGGELCEEDWDQNGISSEPKLECSFVPIIWVLAACERK